MKKIIYIIIALLSIYGVSTYFIGEKTKEELKSYIEKSNRIYADSGVELKLLEYNKSFFNSTAQIQIDMIDPNIQKILQEDYIFPLKLNYQIENGPIFFKNGLSVGLSKIENRVAISSILKEDSKKEFLKLVKDDINIKTDISLAFNKKLNYSIESDSVTIHDNNKILSMTPLKMVGTSDIEKFNGDGKVEILKIELKDDNSTNGLELDNIVLDFNIKEIFKETLLFGDFKFSLGKILIKDNHNPNLKNIDLSINGGMSNKRVQKSMMDSDFNINLNLANTKLEDNFKNLNNIKITANMKNIGVDGMYQFQNIAQSIQNERIELIKSIENDKSQKIRETFVKLNSLNEKMVKEIIPTLNKLLVKDKTSISYSFNIDTKDKESTQATIKIKYTGNIDFNNSIEKITKDIQKELLSIVAFDVDIDLNKKHLPLLPVPMLKEQLQMGVAQGFIRENNSSYRLKGSYKNRELMVNDNNLTSTILPLILMLTAG